MAINPEIEFPGKINPSDADYPYGSARNITSPGDGTGTPWLAPLVNDIFGFQQALLSNAGIVPSGNPDKVGDSQYLDALKKITTSTFDTIADMTAILKSSLNDGQQFSVGGYNGVGDGGGGALYWDALSTEAADNGSVFELDTAPAIGRVKRVFGDMILINQFGAGDGVSGAANAIAIQAAFDYAGELTVVDAVTGEFVTDGYSKTVSAYGRSNYAMSDGIVFTEKHNGIMFEGNGSRFTRDATVGGNSDRVLELIGTDNFDRALNYMNIRNLRLVSNLAPDDAIYMKNAQHNYFENVRATNFQGDTTAFAGTYGLRLFADCWSNTFVNCMLFKNWNNLFVGERCNSNSFYKLNAEFALQYPLQVYRNNNNAFHTAQFEFSGQDPAGDSTLIRANGTQFYACRWDGNESDIRIHGEAGNDFWNYSVGNSFHGCFFTPLGTAPSSFAIRVGRAKNTLIDSCQGYEIIEKTTFGSALVQTSAESLKTILRNNNTENTSINSVNFVDGDVNIATDIISEVNHDYGTGSSVEVSTTGVLPTGLAVSTQYYVIRVDDDNFKLALSNADAFAGTAIDITAAAGGGTHTCFASGDLPEIADASGGSYHTTRFKTALNVKDFFTDNNDVMEFFARKDTAGAAAYRVYTRDSIGDDTARFQISGQEDAPLAQFLNGTILRVEGAWDDSPFRIGSAFFWMNGNDYRGSIGAPISATDGVLIATLT